MDIYSEYVVTKRIYVKFLFLKVRELNFIGIVFWIFIENML